MDNDTGYTTEEGKMTEAGRKVRHVSQLSFSHSSGSESEIYKSWSRSRTDSDFLQLALVHISISAVSPPAA